MQPDLTAADQEAPIRHDADGAPVFADWTQTEPESGHLKHGDQPAKEEEDVDVETPPEPEPKPKAKAKRSSVKPKSAAKRRADLERLAEMTDEQLLAEYGVEPIFSTTEAADFFDRSNQWLYWGLREGIFTYPDGSPIEPERVGDEEKGRRRFTIPIIRDILLSSYRRGNVEPDELKRILRRISIAELGGDWKATEGWVRKDHKE